MKVSWPRRKKKRLVSLFEGHVPWPYEGSGAEPFRMPPVDPRQEKAHPWNARGPFYVVHGWCMACGFPHSLAPELIAPPEDQPDSHCFFKKQPETPAEIEQAAKAIAGACCGAFRYAGSDPAVIAKLKEAGADDVL